MMAKIPDWVTDEFRWLDGEVERAERELKDCERKLESAFDDWRDAKRKLVAAKKDWSDHLDGQS